MPPLTYVVDPWLSLVGRISALARLTLTNFVIYFLIQLWLLLAGDTSVLARLILLFYFLYSTVAVTGRRHLHPRPVDFVILFSYSTVAVTGRRHLRPRPVDFVILFSLLDYGCYWPETSLSSPGRF